MSQTRRVPSSPVVKQVVVHVLKKQPVFCGVHLDVFHRQVNVDDVGLRGFPRVGVCEVVAEVRLELLRPVVAVDVRPCVPTSNP